MKKFTHIALMVNASTDFGRAICRGVVHFVREHGDWLLFPVEPGVDEVSIQNWLRVNRIAGVISGGSSREVFLHMQETGLPLVSLSYRDINPGTTAVNADPEAISRMAAEFFLRAGFWNFAFCGYPESAYSAMREAAFQDILGAHGRTLHVLPHAPHAPVAHHGYDPISNMASDRLLGAWLRSLPKPVALLACNDSRGQQLLRIAQECEIDVPGEMAVLGVDNDEILCTVCHPALSSIEPNGEAIGRAAALALDGLLRKTIRPGVQLKIPPLRIVERQSTGIPPMENQLMIRAMRIIRDAVRDNLTVKALCAELGSSRTRLDMLFKEHLGRTPSDEITRVRVKHVTELLHGTPLSIKEIANLSGFTSAACLSHFIRRETGGTPRSLRQQDAPTAPPANNRSPGGKRFQRGRAAGGKPLATGNNQGVT